MSQPNDFNNFVQRLMPTKLYLWAAKLKAKQDRWPLTEIEARLFKTAT
jgi:hypothetical protein